MVMVMISSTNLNVLWKKISPTAARAALWVKHNVGARDCFLATPGMPWFRKAQTFPQESLCLRSHILPGVRRPVFLQNPADSTRRDYTLERELLSLQPPKF